jgi:hypothetical protein
MILQTSYVLNHNNGTLVVTVAGNAFIYDNNATSPTFYNFTVNNAAALVQWYNTKGSSTMTIANNLNVASGTYDNSDGGTGIYLIVQGDTTIAGTCTSGSSASDFTLKNINISGTFTQVTSQKTYITGKDASNNAWTNTGTHNCGTGLVDFQGQSGTYHIHGDNTWYRLEISLTAACTYLFENGKTQEITNSTVLTGAVGEILTLNSVSGAATWLYTIDTGKTQTQTYLNVTYSDASGGDLVHQTLSTDGGFNTNWDFPITGGVPVTTSLTAKLIGQGLI